MGGPPAGSAPLLCQGPLLTALLLALGVAIGYTLHQLSEGAAAGVPPPLLPRAATHGAAASAASRFHAVPCPPPRQPGTPRRNLVFAAVGDDWSPDKWTFGEHASWDLIAVYYGNRTDWSCPQCTLGLSMPGSMKWQMLWALMSARSEGEGAKPQLADIWQGMRRSYDYVMVADDDLVMDACVIDIFFEAMRKYKLSAAQPSNCPGNDSDNPYWVHWQIQGMALHYVNLIEVTAPGLSMDFLAGPVRPLLQRTYSGWGLPLCFWAAANFAMRRLAAVDAACMIHPARSDVGEKLLVSERIRRGLIKPGSIYARFKELTPFVSPKAEQNAIWQQCGFLNPKDRANRLAIYGTEPLDGGAGGAAAAEGEAAGAEAEAAADAATDGSSTAALSHARLPRGRQHLLSAEGLRSPQLWQQPLALMGLLALAAGVGAVAALQCQRPKDGMLPLSIRLRSPLRSPPRLSGHTPATSPVR